MIRHELSALKFLSVVVLSIPDTIYLMLSFLAFTH